MAAKAHIKKGDTVTVISGDADKFDSEGNLIRAGIKGKSGKVLQVFPKKGRISIEGLRMIKKHQKPTQTSQQGGIQEREGTIAISNVKLSGDSVKEKKTRTAKTKTAKTKTAKAKTTKGKTTKGKTTKGKTAKGKTAKGKTAKAKAPKAKAPKAKKQ